jgi:plastocyanin
MSGSLASRLMIAQAQERIMILRSLLIVAAVAGLAVQPVQAQDNAAIKGQVKWEGKTRKAKPVKGLEADPFCHKLYEAQPLLQEDLVFNTNETVKNVFVYVSKGLPEGRKWPVPTTPVVLNQKGCHYVPHVFGVMAGQDISIVNSDATAHNIHALPKNNKEFNRGQPQAGMEFKEKFTNPEIMVDFKCDVHPWMSAKCAVMEHPFFAVTGEDGTFEIKNLPPGTYTVKTWAEYSGLSGQEQTVTVGTGETKSGVDFVGKPPQKGGDE